jgi:hypothetical protein
MTPREKGERETGRWQDDLGREGRRWVTTPMEEKKIERIDRADTRSGSFKEAIS